MTEKNKKKHNDSESEPRAFAESKTDRIFERHKPIQQSAYRYIPENLDMIQERFEKANEEDRGGIVCQ